MKRALFLLIAIGLLLGAAPAQAAGIGGAFTDDDGSFHEPDINGIAAVGITLGCGGTNFCPLGSVTRAEMASFLVRSLALTPSSTGPFTDIAGNIHAENINALAAAGITSGCSATAFCPMDLVSREQMATFLARALELAPVASTFTDVGPGPHFENIGAIAVAGITTGCGPGLFCPYAAVTREQMATFLVRAFKIDPIYPQIDAVAGRFPWCTKDGLMCYVSVTVPLRNQYEVREGFYELTEEPTLESASTRVEMTLNGLPLTLTDLGVIEASTQRQRTFRAITGLSPGIHTLLVRWYWNGLVEQTTTVIISVYA
ncbi:MAG: S-layer homology domain-containing protein [Actinomycetota bacterium]|nr:S-layer homology domain-containing protein [Actinomycetota bacterium]